MLILIRPTPADFSCGAAALATIFRYAFGKDMTEPEVLDGRRVVMPPDNKETRIPTAAMTTEN